MVFDWIRPSDFRKETLFSCSLVSKSWRAMALRHCFYSLSLIYRMKSYPETSDLNYILQDFVEADIFADVQYLVRKLALQCGKIGPNPIELDIATYLRHFPALRHFTLAGRVHERLSLNQPFPVLPLSLSTLAIVGQPGSIHNIIALYDLLSLFRPVRHIYLRNLKDWGSDSLSPDLDAPPLLELRSFTLHALPVASPLTDLLSLPSVMRCVECFEFHDETTLAGLSFVKLHKPDVTHLTFAIDCK